MEELKPCPFCGANAKLTYFKFANEYAIDCSVSCQKLRTNKEKAIKAWNKRVK